MDNALREVIEKKLQATGVNLSEPKYARKREQVRAICKKAKEEASSHDEVCNGFGDLCV
jgi:adenosylmethionine-8-amino-7-oxononanoate aminotransferase